MDRVEIGDLRNSGKGGQGNGGKARSIAGNSGKGLWNSAD